MFTQQYLSDSSLFLIKRMGAVSCHDHRYQQINQKYGKEFKQFVVREKGRTFFVREISKAKKNVSKLAESKQKQLIQDLQVAQAQVEQYLSRIMSQLDKKQAGGIEALEQMTRNTSQELLGYVHIKQSFASFNREIKKMVKKEEAKMINELTQLEGQYEQQYLQNQPPYSHLLASMPHNQRESMIAKGQIQFQTQIAHTQKYLLNRYSGALSQQQVQFYLSNNNCQSQLEKMVSLGKDKLLTSLNLILSETVESYIVIK